MLDTAARGVPDAPALEMTKWFDTNYHYLVPNSRFALTGTAPIDEVREAQALGITPRPVLFGPVTFLLLAKPTEPGFTPLEPLDELLPAYAELLGKLADEGVEWVQSDEPAFATDRTTPEFNALTRAYHWLAKKTTARSSWQPDTSAASAEHWASWPAPPAKQLPSTW